MKIEPETRYFDSSFGDHYVLTEGDKRLIVSVYGDDTSETDVKKIEGRKKPGSTTTLYRRGRELIQLEADARARSITYTFDTKDPSMMIWARHPQKGGEAFPDWVVENNSLWRFSASVTFHPKQIRTVSSDRGGQSNQD